MCNHDAIVRWEITTDMSVLVWYGTVVTKNLAVFFITGIHWHNISFQISIIAVVVVGTVSAVLAMAANNTCKSTFHECFLVNSLMAIHDV